MHKIEEDVEAKKVVLLRFFRFVTTSLVLALFMTSCSKSPVMNTFDIKLGTQLGPLKFDMTKEQVKQAIGKPSFETDYALNYNALGFTVIFNRKGKIGSINCGSMDADAQLLSSFKGSTDASIKLGSLTEEVLGAYGKPTEIRQDGIVLRYENLSTDFVVRDARVICIVLRPKIIGQ